jgi:hypothetical protein
MDFAGVGVELTRRCRVDPTEGSLLATLVFAKIDQKSVNLWGGCYEIETIVVCRFGREPWRV